jgi:hypothetical protein
MERCLPADRADVQNNTIFWAGTPADFSIPQSEGDPGHEFNGQRGAPHQHTSAAPRLHRRGPHMGAERYQVGDVLRYSRASKETGTKGAYLRVKSIDAPNNRLKVELQDGSRASRFFERRCGVFQWATASSSPRRPTTSELRTASWAPPQVESLLMAIVLLHVETVQKNAVGGRSGT